METINKALPVDLSLTEGDRSFVVTMTTQAPDRDGDVLLPSGMNSKNYEGNPIIFYNHDGDKLPIGRVSGLKRSNTGWRARCTLATRPEGHVGEWLPDTLLHLVKERVLSAVSVGFIPHQKRLPTQKDIETYGEDTAQVITRWELLELSLVNIPCNQEALVMAVSKDIKSGMQIDGKNFDLPEEPKEKHVIKIKCPPKPKHVISVQALPREKHDTNRREARSKCKLYYKKN